MFPERTNREGPLWMRVVPSCMEWKGGKRRKSDNTVASWLFCSGNPSLPDGLESLKPWAKTKNSSLWIIFTCVFCHCYTNLTNYSKEIKNCYGPWAPELIITQCHVFYGFAAIHGRCYCSWACCWRTDFCLFVDLFIIILSMWGFYSYVCTCILWMPGTHGGQKSRWDMLDLVL